MYLMRMEKQFIKYIKSKIRARAIKGKRVNDKEVRINRSPNKFMISRDQSFAGSHGV